MALETSTVRTPPAVHANNQLTPAEAVQSMQLLSLYQHVRSFKENTTHCLHISRDTMFFQFSFR